MDILDGMVYAPFILSWTDHGSSAEASFVSYRAAEEWALGHLEVHTWTIRADLETMRPRAVEAA